MRVAASANDVDSLLALEVFFGSEFYNVRPCCTNCIYSVITHDFVQLVELACSMPLLSTTRLLGGRDVEQHQLDTVCLLAAMSDTREHCHAMLQVCVWNE